MYITFALSTKHAEARCSGPEWMKERAICMITEFSMVTNVILRIFLDFLDSRFTSLFVIWNQIFHSLYDEWYLLWSVQLKSLRILLFRKLTRIHFIFLLILLLIILLVDGILFLCKKYLPHEILAELVINWVNFKVLIPLISFLVITYFLSFLDG